MVGISGRWASRWRGQGSDKMGRWSWMDLKGKGGKIVRVLSGYRVSQTNSKDIGPLTACQQQFNSLVFNNSTTLNPKKAFLQDLCKFIKDWKKQGDDRELVVMLDANDQLTEKN